MEPEETDSNVAKYMSLFVEALEAAVETMKSLRVPADSTPTAQRDGISCAEARARVDVAAAKLRETLLDGPLASQNPAQISRTLRERLFASLKGGLDVIRELYAEMPEWAGIKTDRFMSIWFNLEIQLALEDTQEHLEYMERRPIRQFGFPYSPIHSPTGIRLARLLPHHDPEGTIECQLLNVDHYQDRTYAVLSYASGSQQHTQNIPILVDSYAFPITPNLHAALQHFRHETRPRLLWVDALCINQSDPADKSSQVDRMRAIYQNAYTILMWTGPEFQNSSTAMGVFLALEDIFAPEPAPRPADVDTDSDSYSDSYSHSYSYSNSYTHSTSSTTTRGGSHKNEVYPYLMHPLIATSLIPAVLADPNGVATRAFFNRAYWQRVWTLTETVMKRNSLLCCGKYGVTWGAVAQGAREAKGVAIAVGLGQTVTRDDVGGGGGGGGNSDLNSVTDTLWIARVFEPVLGHAELTARFHDPDGGGGISLVDALVVGSRGGSALDARDYVYGVLPIAVGHDSDVQVQADYNKPAFQMYMDLVRDEVHRSASWDILSACRLWDFVRQRERFVPLEEFVQSCLGEDDGGGVPGLAAVAEALRDSEEDDGVEVPAESRRGNHDYMGRVIAFSLARGGVTPQEEHKKGDDEYGLEGGPGTFEEMAMAWLPSWVPRWDMPVRPRQTDMRALFAREGQPSFHAAPGTTPRYAFKGYRGSQLQVTGTKVDIVHSVTLAGDFASMWDHWVQTRESRNVSDPAPDLRQQGGGPFRSVSFGLPLNKLVEKKPYGLRAVSAGLGNLSMRPKRQQRAVSQPVSHGTEPNPPDKMHSGARRAITLIAEAIADRRRRQQGLDLAFFVTENGFVGLGPMAMESGDAMCVFLGGRAPFVLRPHQESFYLVGEACE